MFKPQFIPASIAKIDIRNT
ncbi:hypothetical protein CCACVL1_07356 [Corchorus capsularis]|uniref:Uncharacterized protein n=1 Tax=Corchorus capsularis TaxID=210143 RepID=A0A1R3J6P8_COCAP|nr:hypothetical protein CCACVL1_25757 [Corchorus capsularis]OMO90487.1 hypothetical protein CCACVL1_07356 [Corchorus capsularis]